MKYFTKTAEEGRGLATAATGYAGYRGLKGANKGGYLTGREALYHVTDIDNISSIREKGIKGFSRELANSKKGMTSGKLSHIPEEALKGKTYAYKDRILGGWEKKLRNLMGERRGGVKIKIPVGEYKEVANPELLGSKKKFVKRFMDTNIIQRMVMEERLGKKATDFLSKQTASHAYKTFGPKKVKTIQGDIKPEHIKGSKKYIKNSLKEFASYVKRNPRKFAKGAGKALAGTALLAASAHIATGGKNKTTK